MPETTSTNELRWHPDFDCYGYDVNTTRTAVVWDFGRSTTEQFLVPSRHSCWAYDESGEKHRHYVNDSSLIRGEDENYQNVFFRSKQAAESAGFKFSLRIKKWAKEAHQEFYGTETLLQYHSNDARANYTKPEDVWHVGVEVEKEDRRLQADCKVWKLFQDTGWVKEKDGSLSSEGFELISPVMPLTDTPRLKKICRPVKKYLDASHSNRCGGHMNLSKKGWTAKQVLANLKAGAAFLYAIYPHRVNNNYCRVKDWNRYECEVDKYSAFYCKNNKVCEIRLFPAVKSYKNLMWRISLMRILLNIHGDSFVEKVVNLENENTYLYQHLRLIYSPEKIKEIAQRAVKMYERFVAPLKASEKRKLNALGYSTTPITTDELYDDNGRAIEENEPF